MKMYSGTRYASGRNFNYYKKPFYKTKGFYILLLILLLILGFIFWSVKRTDKNPENINQKYSDENNTPILSAKVVTLSGKVEIQNPDSDWVELAENYQVRAGETVRTSEKAKVIIELPDQSFFRMNENSEIELTQIGLADIIINQKHGEVFHRVNDQSPAIYRVKNNDIELTALGTAFNIVVDKETVNLVVTENKVKAKIYKDEDIQNMRTIDEGTEAKINPNLAVDKMIESKTINATDLMSSPWYNWNIEQDTAQKLYLGIFAKATKLIITEPTNSETKTDKDFIIIKGVTDQEAEIFIDGKEPENKNGNFEFNYKLAVGENKITITVKKDKNINKKILTVNCTKIDDAIKLTGSVKDNNVTLSWTTTELKELYSLKVLMSKKSGAITYPAEQEHSLKSTDIKDTWNKLENGQYTFRICAYAEKEVCKIYSNQITLTIGTKEETESSTPPESEKPAADASTSTKGYILLSGSDEGNQVTLNWLLSDFTAEKGVYIIMNNNANILYPGKEKIGLASGTSYTWNNLISGQTYYFRVCENLTNKCGRYSNEYSATIK